MNENQKMVNTDNEEQFVCECCGEIFNIGEEECCAYDGKFYCESCFEDNFTTCDDCCEVFPRDMVAYYESVDRVLCNDCREENYFYCANCDQLEHNCNSYCSADGDICEYCADYEYTTCDRCGERVHNDLICYDEDDDYYYCQECYSNHQTRAIHSYHHSHNHSVQFFGGTDDGNTLFEGVELEIDNGEDREETASEMLECMPNNFITMENDGSLDRGFENITQPATLEYHLSIRDKYEDMFAVAKQNGFRSHNTTTCGYHIHFNRSFFGDKEDECIAKLLYLVEKFWDELVKFSRRNYDNLERWAKKYDKTPNEVVEDMKCHNLDRYRAVNLTNRNTIEFRMFRGTLKSETFFATLQLVDIIVRYVKDHTNNDIQALNFEDLLVTDELVNYWERVKNRRA